MLLSAANNRHVEKAISGKMTLSTIRRALFNVKPAKHNAPRKSSLYFRLHRLGEEAIFFEDSWVPLSCRATSFYTRFVDRLRRPTCG